MTARWMVLMGVFVAAAPAWGADDFATLDAHVAAITRTGQTPEGQQAVVGHLSQELGISAKTLQAQRQQTGLGWGEILIANRIAQRAGMTFSQVVGEFRGGKGWGEIARENHLNLGKLVSDVKESRTAAHTSIAAGSHRGSASGDARITSGANRAQAGAEVSAGAGEGMGHGLSRGGDAGLTFGAGASGHGLGGGLGLHGGGRR